MLNDNDALQIFNALPGEQDPTRKATMAQALGEYRDAKAAAGLRPFQPSPEEKRMKTERYERLYSGVDGVEATLAPEQKAQLDGMLATSPNPDEAKARMVNMAYLSDSYGDKLPAGWNEANWPAVKRSFAKEALGIDKPEVTDTELFGAIGAKVEQDRAERQMMGKMIEGVALAAFEGAPDYLEAYSKVAPSIEGDVGYDAASRDRYRAVAKAAFSQMKERADRLRPVAERIVTSLAREQETQDMGGAMGFSMDELVAMVADIPDEDRPMLYAVVARAAAKSPDAQPDKSLGKQSGEAVGRGVVDVLRANRAALKDNPDAINARALAGAADRVDVAGERRAGESVLDWVNRSQRGNYGLVDFARDVVTQNGQPLLKNRRKLTEDEQAALKDEVATAQRTRAIRKELRDIAEGVVDPIKGENFVTEKVLYPFFENAAYTAQAFVPYAGLPLLVSSTMGMRSEEMMARGVPIEEAQKLALASAAIEAPVEYLQAKMVAGAFPIFKKLLEVPVTGLGQLAGRAAAVFGVQLVEQNVQEAVQDAAPLVVQHVASKLSDTVPGIDWEKELKAYGAQRVDTFWALLPMVLIGTGTATFSDAAYGQAYLNDMTVLKAAGFTEEAAARIVEAPTMELKQALIRSSWNDTQLRDLNGAAARAAAEDMDAEMRATYAEQSVETGARVVRLENGEWAVESGEGELVDTAGTPEAALDLVRDYNAAQSGDSTRAILDAIEYVERFQEAGQSVELVEGSRSLQDLADAGEFTQDEADAIVDTYVALGRLEAGASASDALVTGENQVTKYDARRRIVEDVSRIYDGATPLTVIEEHAEGYLKRRLSAGDVTLEDVAAWRESVGADGGTDERSLIEFFSEQAQAYMVGKSSSADVPASFRAFLNRLRDYFRRIMDLAARLMQAEAAGTLPADFKTHLARSVGLDEAYVTGLYREQERAEAANTDQELSAWVKGRLPHPDDARSAGEPLAGELRDLFDGMGSRQKAQAFFRRKGSSGHGLDSVVEASREAGFPYQTPAELLGALDDSLRGIPQFPDYSVEADGAARSFSLSDRQTGELLAVHNTREKAIRQFQDLGGLAVPSVAVIRPGVSRFDSFGDITLVAGPEMVDPKRDKAAKVFNADVYSPRFPSMRFKVDVKQLRAVWKELSAESAALGNRLSSEVDEEAISREGLQAFEDSTVVKFAWLKSHGVEPDVQMEKVDELPDSITQFKGTRWEIADNPEFAKAVAVYYNEKLAEYPGTLADDFVNPDTGLPYTHVLNNMAGQLSKLRDPKLDIYATREALQKQVDTAGVDDFKAWVRESFSRVIAGKQVGSYNENTGSMRWLPYQLEDVVKVMKRDLRDGEGFNYGVGSIRANVARQFRSLEGMRKDADKIVKREAFKQLKEEVNAEFERLAEALRPFYKFPGSGYLDQVSQSFKELAVTPSRWSENFSETPASLMNEVRGFLEKLKNMPTEYFEAKIQRGVSLSEFRGAVVPSDTSADVRKILERAGIDVVEYPRGDIEARAAALGNFGQLTFGIESRKRVEEIQDGMKMRRVAERVAAAEHAGEAFDDAVRVKMSELMYQVVPNKVTVAEAMKIVTDKGVPGAMEMVLDPATSLPPNVRVAVGLGLMEHFNEVGNYDTASMIGERVAELGTELGRGVQVFSLLGRILDTPEKAQVFLARQVKKAEVALREKTPAIDAAKDVLVDIQAEALKLLEGWLDQINGVAGRKASLKPARVEDLPDLTFSLSMDMRRSGIVSTVARMLKESGAVETRKALVSRYGERINPHLADIFIEAQKQILQRATGGAKKKDAKAKKDAKKGRPTGIVRPAKEVDAALDEIRREVRKSDVQLDITPIDEHFRGKRLTPDEVESVLKEARAAGVKVRQELLDMPMGEDASPPLMTPEEVDAELDAIRADAEKSDVQLDMTAINEHFRGRRLSPAELENVLATARAFGLGNQVQTQLAGLEEIAQRFEDEVIARMKVRGLATPQAVRDAVRRLFEMKGVAWTAADIDRVFGDKFKVPAATDAQQKRLAELAKNIRSTPEFSAERTDATIEMMNFVNDILKPVDAVDKAWAVWYANVLSGYNTHFRNLYANVLEQTISLPLDAVRLNPVATLQLMREMLYGVKAGASIGALEAKRQLQTGDASILQTEANKFGTAGTLERVEFAGGRANPFNWLKVVGRALRAEDLFAYSTAVEAKARMVAWEMATQKGMTGEAREAEIARILNDTEEQIGDFKERAARDWEKMTPELKMRTTEAAWTERRVKELRLLERDAALIERASEFAARATFNYKPDGFVGIMANSLIDFLGRVSSIETSGRQEVLLKALATSPKLVVPFVRIVANVLNRGIDYAGLGVVRAASPVKLSGSVASGVEFKAKTPDERVMELKRGIFGIITLGVLSALADPNDDDAPIQIHGAGSGSRDKNMALHGPRWMPYSIEVRTSEGSKFITYKYSPLLIGLAVVAGWHDAIRYKKLDEKEQTARLAVAITGAGSVLLDQSFLSNAADAMNMFSRDGQVSERAVFSFLGRTFNPATVAIPFANLLNNIARDFDPVRRDKTSIEASLMANVPVASYLEEPALDVLGDAIPNRPFDWFVTAEQDGTPEARIYRAFAAKNAAPTSIWSYKGKMGPDQFYDFTRERGAWMKAELLKNDAAFLKKIEAASPEVAEALVENLSRSATVFARYRVGYKPEGGSR